jgi:nucleotide-binding universal stress UspA family protein
MAAFSIILHPTDLSQNAMAAFQVACRLAPKGGRLIVLHVQEKDLVASEDYLARLNHRLREFEAPDPSVTLELRLEEGQAAVEILRMAGEVGCDLIVMGSHGRTGLRRLLTGSVAEAVLRQARCPVLVVKSPPTEGPYTELPPKPEGS